MIYDVVILGTGPAGIFTALTLVERNPNLKILMIEKGKPINERTKSGVDLTSGWSGSSGYSDNKCVYSLDSSYGGTLQDTIKDLNYFSELMKSVDDVFMRFLGGEKEIKTYGDKSELVEPLKLKAARLGILLMSAKIKHYGTDNGFTIFSNIYNYLKDKVEIRFNTELVDFVKETTKTAEPSESKFVCLLNDKSVVVSKYLVLAPGRSGNKWFSKVAKERGIETKSGKIDLGVRIEYNSIIGKEIDSVLYEPKCVIRLPNDVTTRSFCYCPRGEIAMESIKDGDTEYVTVNGHSNHSEEKKTKNTNFALLVSSEFSEPFNDPLQYGRSVVKLSNLLGGGKPIIQRLKDIKLGRRSTEKRISEMNLTPTLKEATPGDLSLCFPAKIFNAIVDSIKILDTFIPGLYGDDVVLYGVEAKWYSVSAKLKPNLESTVDNVFCIGDGAGCTRSEVQAAMSGLIVGKEIAEREK